MLAFFAVLLATSSISVSRPTSITDYYAYNQFCQDAANDPHQFAHFKASGLYQLILEHVSFEQGRQYLDLIIEQSPELLEKMDSFRKNDAIGHPNTYFYDPIGIISPTTLRYIKVASDLKLLFGSSLNGSSIIEIGGGYGGQCKIMSDLFQFKKYTIVDLPGPLALTKKFLEAQNISNVTYKTFDEVISDETFDLIISNFAYTECSSEMQEKYAREILAHSKRGYMTCSEGGKKKLESFDRLKRYGISFEESPERPSTGCCQNGEPNYVLTWKEPPEFILNNH